MICESALSSGWSRTTAGTFSASTPPTDRCAISASPFMLKMKEAAAPGLTAPDSSPAFELKRQMGAPTSKIMLYGPLPLTFAFTRMWLLSSSSNGTEIDLSSFLLRAERQTWPEAPRWGRGLSRQRSLV